MTRKLFIFDWNGTLLPDTAANHAGFNETLKFFNAPAVSHEQYRDTMDFPLVHVYTRNGVHPDLYLEKFQQATDIFFETYRPLAKFCPLQDGTTDLLDYLAEQGFDLMILSNQNDIDLRDQIAERHITHYFKIISGNQENSVIGYTKTNKLERLQAILNDNEYDLSQSYIIGDSLEEPDIARRLGLTCFSVTWGCFSRHRLEKGPAAHVIDALAEIPGILQKSLREKELKEAV